MNNNIKLSLFKDLLVQIKNPAEYHRLAKIMDANGWKLETGHTYGEFPKVCSGNEYSRACYDLYSGRYLCVWRDGIAERPYKLMVSISDFESLYESRTSFAKKNYTLENRIFCKCIFDIPNLDTIINDFVLDHNISIVDIKFSEGNTMAVLIYRT